MVGELAALPCVDEANEVAEQRRVDSLAALVCRNPRQLQKLVDLLLGQVE